MNVFHFHYAHRESARMIVNLREWRSSLFESDECTSLPLDASWISENDRESARMTINSWFSCSESQSSNRDERSKLYQQVNCRSSCFSSQSASQQSIFLLLESVNQSIVDFSVLDVSQSIVMRNENSINKSIVDLLSVSRHQLISTIIIFLFKRWDIALLKRKIEVTHNNLTSNQQTITQNLKQKIFELSLRFVSVSANLSATMTFSEFATMTSESTTMISKVHAFFDSLHLRSQHQ